MKTDTISRAGLICALLLCCFAAVLWRLFLLQVLRHEELSEKAERYRSGRRVIQAWRGPIQSRDGTPLVVTQPVKNIYADLAVWEGHVGRLARTIAPHLGMHPDEVTPRLYRRIEALRERGAPVSGAVLLKRGLTPEKWARVREALALESFELDENADPKRSRRLLRRFRAAALFAEDDQSRVYLYGRLAAHMLGFVSRGTNGHRLQGRMGVEAACDPGLAGWNGSWRAMREAAGRDLAFTRSGQQAVRDGASVTLTIDLRLQQIVEAALDRAMTRWQPSNATCVVARPATGEILAMAGRPDFDPHRPGDSPPHTWRNRVISDRHEVGSVFKVITLAAALELGATSLDSRVDCEQGRWVYRKLALHDRGRSHGVLTVRECLAKSTNIGLAKLGVGVGDAAFYRFVRSFGFDDSTGISLPYEIDGFIRPPENWHPDSITRLAIGHELQVTQIELAMAYCAIANGGLLRRPLLVSRVDHADGSPWVRCHPAVVRRVIRPETARLVREAMQTVVESGTGKAARLPDHTVAGKTGTAQKSDGREYVPGRVLCSFAGMVPASRPGLVIVVAVDEPRGRASGGAVAGPVFREIAERAVKLYGIPPDKAAGRPGASSRPSPFYSVNLP